MRRPHVLRSDKQCQMPHEAIWVDTETKPEIDSEGDERHRLFFGYAAYSRTRNTNEWTTPEWIKFTTVGQFWEWVISRLHGKSRLYVFAHNWAFDAPVLDTFNYLPEAGFKLTSCVIQSPPVILKWRKSPHTIQMIDTLNIWRMPLKKLGESINLPKLVMPSYEASQDEWDAYGKRDVEIIMQACFKWWGFLKSNDLGGFASTLASQSIKTFRYKFMEHEILIDDNEKALSLARNTLHGGRTECHFIGKVKERIYKLDINSHYPFIMQSESVPRKLLGHYKDISLKDIKSWLKHYCISAECRIKTEQAVFPIMHEKRLVFPVGEFTAYLSTPEIAYGLEHKLIKKVVSCNIYEHARIFKKYIDWFYNYRLQCRAEGNEVDAYNCKIFMNSLYGKFAQRGMIYNKIGDTDSDEIKLWSEYDAETGETFKYRQYAHIIEEFEDIPESRDSHPAIAAHITAHARMQLWGLMQKAGEGNYYYCDTDSLWCNEEGYNNLLDELDDKELGKLGIEGIHDDVIIYAPKDYVIDGEAKTKGIKKNAVEIRHSVFEQVKFTTLVGLLRKGDLSAPIVSKVTKRLKRIYSKGSVAPNGEVSPLRFPLEDI